MTAATAAVFIFNLPVDVAAVLDVVSQPLSPLHFRPPNTWYVQINENIRIITILKRQRLKYHPPRPAY